MRNILLTGILAMLCTTSAFAYGVPGADAPDGAEVYIVTFGETGALNYKGDIPELKGTEKIIKGRKKNAAADPDVKAYRGHLDNVIDNYDTQFEAALGRSVTPLLRYTVRRVGMAVLLTAAEAQHVAGMPGVLEVRKDQMYELDTDAGPQWIGAEAIWSGTGTPDSVANFGEGVVVGVLDTGVNMDHPSFSDSPEDGHTYVNPLGSGNFIGDCDATFVCNDKLIGVYDFVDAVTAEDDGPEDGNGHGSHTASTAAGNFVSGPFTSGDPFDAPSVSGVARHANLITYDVCFQSCPGGALQAAMDQALLDGVDVLNYSISGGNNPWLDFDRDFLDLVANGTVVNASAGNTTDAVPDPVGNVAHRGPWVNTVANQTHNRVNSNSVSAVGGPSELQDMYGLLGVLDAFGGSDVTEIGVYGGEIGDGGNLWGCLPWTGDYDADFTDRVVLVSRGGEPAPCGFADKIANATLAGASGVLVFNNQSVLPIVMGGIEATTIPSLMIGQTDGEDLRDYLLANPGTEVTMSGTSVRSIIDSVGSFINAGSLRGPNDDFDVTKPDVGGPGTNIYAAYSDVLGPNPYAFLSGTSMSSPHAAGASALLKSIHPDWTPPQIKSALMMTARQGFDEAGNPATPDHEGSGTVDLSKAALAGLVMHETFDNFLAANPTSGGDPGTLNLPSMRANDCNESCEWTRTVCSTLDVDSSWTINFPSPSGYVVSAITTGFDLLPKGSVLKAGFEDPNGAVSSCQTFTVSVQVTDDALVTAGELIFDQITLSEDAAQSPDLKMTITFLPTGVVP